MLYKQALQYLNSFVDYEKIGSYSYEDSFKLERMNLFLKEIGNPQDKFKSIHISGTKGKGSTAAFVYSILKEAGFKVGLYTSPHLISFRERVRISNKNFAEELIKEEEVCQIVAYLEPIIDKLNRESKLGNLTFFEIYTALAFLYFFQAKVDFAVLEVGLGGRLDATNTVKPLVCAVTPISFDHMDKLGNRLSDIAREKSGIIKDGTFVVTAPQEEEAMKVIERTCLDKQAKLYKVGRDILWEKVSNDFGADPEPERFRAGQIFNLKGIYDEYSLLKISLLGEHQIINAATALGLIELLRNYNIFISPENIAKGFNNAYWPGRLQVISLDPLIVLDGAQNLASAVRLQKSIEDIFPLKKIILVLGISADKDIEGIGKIICPAAQKVIFTGTTNPRSAQPEFLKNKLSPYCRDYALADNPGAALALAKKIADRNTMILVTGSLYLVGEVLKLTNVLRLEEVEA